VQMYTLLRLRHPKSPFFICNSLIYNMRYVMAKKSDEVRNKVYTQIFNLIF
jgi:hypothetical protein